MRVFQLILAAGALTALPACNLLAVAGGESSSSGNESAAKGDEPEEKGEERGSRRSGDEPTRNESGRDEGRTETASNEGEWILGRWGNAGCATVLDFQSDGTVTIGEVQAEWMLDGDTLTLSGGGNQQAYTITRESGGFSIEDAEGNVQQLGRC